MDEMGARGVGRAPQTNNRAHLRDRSTLPAELARAGKKKGRRSALDDQRVALTHFLFKPRVGSTT